MATEEGNASGLDRERSSAQPNDLLRQARLRTPSPQNRTRPMSQKELAEAVTAHVYRTTERNVPLDRHDISRWERGTRRRPIAEYRTALRAVLGVSTDAELGFHKRPPEPRKVSAAPVAGAAVPLPAQIVSTSGAAVQVIVNPGTVVVLLPITAALLGDVVPTLAPRAQHIGDG